MRIALACLVPWIACCVPSAAQDRPASQGKSEVYKLEVKKARPIEAVLTQDYRLLRPVEALILFIPRAPELPGQTDVKTTLDPNGVDGNELSPLRRPIASTKVTFDQLKDNLLPIRVRVKATLVARELVTVTSRGQAPPVAPLKKPDRQAALYPSAMFDFQSAEVKRWMKANSLSRGKTEAEIDFARRVYTAIVKKYSHGYMKENTIIWQSDPAKREISIDQWRASLVSTKKEAHSAGLSVLFVSALRANNVPARILLGQWTDNKKAAFRGDRPFYHVKAEFFAENVGWVPVDLGSAVQATKERDGMAYFGKDPGDFLCLHVDAELVIETPVIKVPAPFLPYVGMTIGRVGGGIPASPKSIFQTVELSWRFRDVE
ncbi:MAG TPA: transglutaminase-like domain-containing protein [Gemmataceae bacterium]|nr:transglutaminase-like domain-containing protein [Gemmataceae bacterium]